MRNKYLLLLITIICLALSSCKEESSLGGDMDINEFINNNIILPPGTVTVSADQIVTSSDIVITGSGSEITGGPTGFGSNVVEGGEMANISIDFSATNGNVTGAGIQFGTDGDVHIIPIDAMGMSNGTLEFEALFPQELCDQVSSICHDILCYEYCVSASAGGDTYTFSAANINELVGFCGACDEPSCQSLLGPDCDGSGGSNTCFSGDWVLTDLCNIGPVPEDCGPYYGDCPVPGESKILSFNTDGSYSHMYVICDYSVDSYICSWSIVGDWIQAGNVLTVVGAETGPNDCGDDPGMAVSLPQVFEFTCNGNELLLQDTDWIYRYFRL